MPKYRVRVEKHESGWVFVTAPNRAEAEDLAQEIAQSGLGWYPESSNVTSCDVCTMSQENDQEPAR